MNLTIEVTIECAGEREAASLEARSGPRQPPAPEGPDVLIGAGAGASCASGSAPTAFELHLLGAEPALRREAVPGGLVLSVMIISRASAGWAAQCST